MCERHLFDGPLTCQAAGTEDDGHVHIYVSATGSWVETKDQS